MIANTRLCDLQRWVYECPDNQQRHRYAFNFHPTLGGAFQLPAFLQ